MKGLLFSRIFRLGIILPALLCLSLQANSSFASEYDDLEILQSDQEGIIFRYLVPDFSRSTIELQGKSFDLFNIPKCCLSDIPGNPQLPVRKVIVAVPPEAELRVEVLEDEGTELPGIDLAFALTAEPDDESPVGYRPVPMKPERVLNQYYPAGIVSFDSSAFLRDQRIVELEIFPIQYNPSRKSVRYRSRITVRINFTGGRGGTFKSGRDPFERIYQNVLLNYEESKGWRRPPRTKGLLKQPGTIYPFGYSEDWYKAVVRENGIYRIDRAMLMQAGAPVTSIDPRTLRMFSGGGKMLPLDSHHPFLEFEEMAIFVSGEEDGQFNADDFILFFGWSTNDWEYDAFGKAIDFHTNPYTDDNVFWLTFDPIPSLPDPKRMQIKDGSLVEQNPFVPTKFKSRIHAEQDNTLRKSSAGYVIDYFNWYWTEVSSTQMFVSLPGGLAQDTVLIKLKHTGSSPSLWVNGEPAEVIDSLSSGFLTVARSFGFRGGLVDTLDISFPGAAFLDWYEIEYFRRFECHDRQLLFESPAISGVTQYEISNLFSSGAFLFDLTDYFEVKKFGGLEIDGEFARFQDLVSADTTTRYLLVDESKIKVPALFFRDESSHLREASNRADFLIITHSDFHDQAQSLRSFRETYDQISATVIEVQDVYDEFSGGLSDPTAIRDFLKFAYQSWEEPAPAFVLLLGDGNYDYKNNLGTGAVNVIPPFAADPSISDDLYVWWGDTLGMVISRLPVRSTREAEVVVDKIVSYEEEPEFGPWRNSITLVADDEWEGPGELDGLWRFHTRDTEILAKSHVPSSFNVSKIYLMEYPFDYKGEKPQAEDAVVNAFNSGTLIINFIGHGNPDVWAHERVFKRSQDIARLRNKRKLPLVYTASCSIGFFFSPFSEGMAEEFVRAEDKGAIATISATWNVWPTPNAELNFKVYDLLLSGDTLSIGEALFIAKILRGLDGNDRKYVLFGDPAMKLGAPDLEVELTEVTPDTLSALSLVQVKGEVQDSEGALITDFDGIAKVTAFDSESRRAHVIPTQPSPSTVNYDMPGPLMFKGDAKAEGGEFQASFVVPKDISYGGNTGRVRVYLEGQDQDGVGVHDSLVIRGSDTTVIDTVGPEISVRFDDRVGFTQGETILPNSILRLSISDQHGINITGEVGHGITLVVDDDFANQTDLTGSFEYDLGDHRRGSASHELPSLAEGDHVLSLKAWDNANNSSVFSASVKVSAQREFELTEVMNHPNPFSNLTNFYYYLSQDADRVQIKIFSLAGRLIKHIPYASSRTGVNFSSTWDGRDEEGDQVANGVYIYKVIAEGVVDGERKMKESLGKAVVVK
ncbi:MAG: type IX secretion system sortase PorU [Candidatus Zixiibacteriota bacterium]|nr:MAG: type IX secretion system sortase PorU [candidate division Zixibacteria bacterium]